MRAERMPWLLLALAMVLLLLAPASAQAHRLRVFAAAEGQWIAGRAYFAGGAAATGARIRIADDQGRMLAEFAPDAEGSFRWQAPAAATYRIEANTGDGHRAQWSITAAELQGAFPPVRENTHQPDPELATDVADAASDAATAPDSACQDVALDARIEQALSRQLQPLREQLSRAEDRLMLRDLLGGIGWIFGLAGLALWWRTRNGGAGR